MKRVLTRAGRRALFAVVVLSSLFISRAVCANDSAEAFMSATFGLSSARTQKRMENSGAVSSGFTSGGRLSMKGAFERRSAVFTFGFHDKKGLNHKSVYIASSGDAASDKALYEGLREAYNVRFGKTDERVAQNRMSKGRIMFQSSWRPNKNTIISLSYNPEVVVRFPGDSPGSRPIHLIYNYTKWTKSGGTP